MSVKPTDQQVAAMVKFYGSIEAARVAWAETQKRAKSDVDNRDNWLAVTSYGEIITDGSELSAYCVEQIDTCPIHGCDCKKVYTFGSSMSAETEVMTFKGCQCSVAIKHSPIGAGSSAIYNRTFSRASGVGRMHAQMAAAKYR